MGTREEIIGKVPSIHHETHGEEKEITESMYKVFQRRPSVREDEAMNLISPI